MTIDALPGKARRSKSTAPEALAIGETDANIFGCPACQRPLGVGTRRCPGCGTRLLSGTRATTILGYAFGGLLVGILVGGGIVGGAVAVSTSSILIETPVASAAPGATSVPGATVAPDTAPGIPSGAGSALRQSAQLNARLAEDAALLAAALDARDPSAAELARILRSLSATASFGDRLVPTLSTWDDAVILSAGLGEAYTSIGAAARDGLSASLANERAYVAAGNKALRLLTQLADLDVDARTLAASAGVELPPASTP